MAVSILSPVPAPLAPHRGLCLSVGPWPRGELHRLIAVSGKSFTVLHNGKRQRHPLPEWHAWLTQLFLSAPVHIQGHRMLSPGEAPLVAGLPPDRRMDPRARRTRVERARGEVLGKYAITSLPERDGRLVFSLAGGTRAWEVEVYPDGRQRPSCQCPDFVHHGFEDRFACKHLLAVLLSQPALRFQALDYFL